MCLYNDGGASATHLTGPIKEIPFQVNFIRDAFELKDSSLTAAFQVAYRAISGNILLPGPKPFVDDGNTFAALAQVPALTHGPRAGGQHTLDEWVSIDDLVRVVRLYALTAMIYCSDNTG